MGDLRNPDMPNDRGDFMSFVAVNAIGVTGVAVSLFDFFLVQKRSLFELSLIGVVVLLAGEAFIFSGRKALGEYFTARIRIAGGQMLIQSGPYKYVRHPIYLGILLQYFAAPIAWRSSYGALVMLAIIPLVLRRIGLEEKAMGSHFGVEYEAYVKRTKKLIPLVY